LHVSRYRKRTVEIAQRPIDLVVHVAVHAKRIVERVVVIVS